MLDHAWTPPTSDPAIRLRFPEAPPDWQEVDISLSDDGFHLRRSDASILTIPIPRKVRPHPIHLACLEAMDWIQFQVFLKRRMPRPSGKGDLRGDRVAALAADPACPYTLPARDRNGMEADILEVAMIEHDGAWLPAWDMRPPRNWNRTGRLRDPKSTPVDPLLDFDWCRRVRENPGIIAAATDMSLECWTGDPIRPLDLPGPACRFLRAGPRESWLVLVSVGNFDLSCRTPHEMILRLAELDAARLRALWVMSRILEVDSRPEQRGEDLAACMHRLRLRFEQDPDAFDEAFA